MKNSVSNKIILILFGVITLGVGGVYVANNWKKWFPTVAGGQQAATSLLGGAAATGKAAKVVMDSVSEEAPQVIDAAAGAAVAGAGMLKTGYTAGGGVLQTTGKAAETIIGSVGKPQQATNVGQSIGAGIAGVFTGGIKELGTLIPPIKPRPRKPATRTAVNPKKKPVLSFTRKGR